MAYEKAAVRHERMVREGREQREQDERARVDAVIAEFGGRTTERMLVPEDDPINSDLVRRLVGEVLFLRGQIRRIVRVMEFVQAGKPFELIRHGP